MQQHIAFGKLDGAIMRVRDADKSGPAKAWSNFRRGCRCHAPDHMSMLHGLDMRLRYCSGEPGLADHVTSNFQVSRNWVNCTTQQRGQSANLSGNASLVGRDAVLRSVDYVEMLVEDVLATTGFSKS